MKMIKCIHCGEESPEFDYAHVCMKGPYAIKLPVKPELEYTPEEDEEWRRRESLQIPRIPQASKEDLERLEREARKPKHRLYPIIPSGDEND